MNNKRLSSLLTSVLLLSILAYYVFALTVSTVDYPTLNTGNISGTIQFSATVNGNESVVNMTFRGINTSVNASGEVVFFVANTTSPNNTQYNVSVDTTTLPSGVYTLNVTATNISAGAVNATVSNSSQTNVTIDNHDPNVTIGSITNFQNLTATGGAYNSTDDLNLTYNVTDVLSGSLNCTVYVNDVQNNTAVPHSNATTLRERTIVDLGNGNFLINVTCIDLAGNQGSQTRNITTDTSTVNTTEIAYADADGTSFGTSAVVIAFGDKIKITCRNTTADNLNFNLTTNISVRSPGQTSFIPFAESSPATFEATSNLGTYRVMCNLTDSTGNVNSTNSTFEVERKVLSRGNPPTGAPVGKKIVSSGSTENLGDLTSDGESRLVGPGGKLSFSANGEDHSLEVKSATEDSVIVILQSEPVEVTIAKGNSESVDLNGDGKDDVTVTYNGLQKGRADITLTEITRVPGEEGAEPAPAPVAEEKSSAASTFWIILIVVVVVIILALVLVKSGKKGSVERKR